jgi:hypothetical protein
MESICCFGSCCDLHQNRFPGRNLCYTDDIAFLFAAIVVALEDSKNLSFPLRRLHTEHA